MGDTIKRLYTGTLSNVEGTLYTVPASTKTIVTEIILANKTAGVVTATIKYGTVQCVPAKSISANDALVIKTHTVLEATETISGLAGAVTSIDCRISGVEVV